MSHQITHHSVIRKALNRAASVAIERGWRHNAAGNTHRARRAALHAWLLADALDRPMRALDRDKAREWRQGLAL